MEHKTPRTRVDAPEKLHVFDRPLALWQELQSMLGGSNTLAPFQMPKFDMGSPALEFLSPTFGRIPAVYCDPDPVHRGLNDPAPRPVMNFADRPARLRTLRILNEIEDISATTF